MTNEEKIILDYLNKHLPVELKRKFEHGDAASLVKTINQLIKDWDEIQTEQNEPDFMKQLKNLQL